MNPTIVQRDFTIRNRQGLHARPAAMLVKLCNTFQSEIWVEKGDEQVNGKSIMGLMMLAANHGAIIKITAEGTDAEAAVEKIGGLIEAGFMEE
jgi:phosphocarrier protein